MIKFRSHTKARLFLVLFTISILLAACGGEGVDMGDKYVHGQDSQFFYSPVFEEGPYLATTEDGYYFVINAFVYFIDKETLKAVPLCNKPNCKHDSDECNAAFHTYDNFLSFYKGSLYVKGEAPDKEERALKNYIYQVSLDGSERKTVLEYKDGFQFGEPKTIHRGYIYFENITPFIWESINVGASISRYDLKDPSEREILFESDLEDANVRLGSIYGNYLYFYELGYRGEENISRSMIYNLETGEIKEMGNLGDDKIHPHFSTIFGGKLMYLGALYITDYDDYDVVEELGGKDAYLKAKNLTTIPLYEADLWGENPKKVMDINIINSNSDIIADSDYVYEYSYNYYRFLERRWLQEEGSEADPNECLKNRYLKVMDKDFNEVAMVDIGSLNLPGNYLQIYLTQGEHIFLKAFDRGNVDDTDYADGLNDGDEVLYVIDKKDFGKEKVEVREILRRQIQDMGWSIDYNELP